MPAEEGAPPHSIGALLLLLVVVYINIAGFSLLLPLLPFLGQAFKASPVEVPLLFSAYSAGALFGEPNWGRLSDRIGRRKVLTLTIACTALSYVAFAFAPNLAAALALRAVSGFFSGNLSVVQGYIADITPPEQRARNIGYFGAAFNLGFVTGPTIGGLLADPSLGAAGFRPPVLAAAGLALAASAWAFFALRERRGSGATAPRPAPARGEAFRFAAAHPIVGRMILIGFFAIVAFASMEAVFGLWTQHNFGWGPRQVGLAFIAVGLAGAFTQAVLVGPLSSRLGEARMVVIGMVTLAASMLLQPLTREPAAAVALMALLITGHSLAFPNVSALISRSTAAEAQGSVLGLHMSAGALARIVGPPLFGLAFTRLGPDAPYYLGAGMIGLALVIALQAVRIRDTQLRQFEAARA